MVFDICVKIKELGSVQGAFLKATRNSIYIKNALMSRASTTTVALLKIDRRYVISVDRMSAPVFDAFTDAELAAALQASPRHAEAIMAVQAARAAAQGRDAAGETGRPEDAGQAGRAGAERRGVARRGKRGEEWDQFEANSKLFGVCPVFDMDEYASPIDTKSTTYRRDLEKSAKIAGEIMSQKTDDVHRLEERGMVRNGDASDERLFSTVRDGGRWERKGGSGAERRREDAERGVSAAAKSATESKMEEELSKQKEILDETINESSNPEKMWANLNKFLSLKKQVQDSSSVVPPEEPGAADAAPERAQTPEERPPSMQGEHARSKQPRAEKPEPRPAGGNGAAPRDGKADREAGRGYKPGGKEAAPAKNGYKGYKKQDTSSETKGSKQVIIGSALRYKNADEFIGRIISKFSPPGAGGARDSWGKGCMIEDKIEYIKKKQMCILPSEQRLSEILSFALYRNKK